MIPLGGVMQVLLSNSTALVLLVHALLGCCWHHAPACHEPEAEPAAAVACCSHHQHAEDGCGHTPVEPCKCKLECHGICTYLPPQKTSLDAPELIVPFDFVALTLATSHLSASPEASWDAAISPGSSGCAHRLHLLHQVLLI